MTVLCLDLLSQWGLSLILYRSKNGCYYCVLSSNRITIGLVKVLTSVIMYVIVFTYLSHSFNFFNAALNFFLGKNFIDVSRELNISNETYVSVFLLTSFLKLFLRLIFEHLRCLLLNLRRSNICLGF